MADSTLTLDAEINTSDWENGVKTIQTGSQQIETSARHASNSMDNIDKASGKSAVGLGKLSAIAGAVGGLMSTGVSIAVNAISNLSGDRADDSDERWATGHKDHHRAALAPVG